MYDFAIQEAPVLLYTNVQASPLPKFVAVPADADTAESKRITCPVLAVIVKVVAAASTIKEISFPCDGEAGKVAVALAVISNHCQLPH